MKDTQTQENFIELRAKNWSFDRIGKELKVSKPTLIAWSREFQLEISNMRALELDALQEKFALTKMKRLELFGERLNSLTGELDKRNLTDLPIEKLLDYILKYGTMLKGEEPKVEFSQKEDVDENLMKNMVHTVVRWEA